MKDVALVDTYRNAMSITGAVNVTVEDTHFVNTGGTWPMCGLDIEPDLDTEKIKGIVLRRVVSTGNRGCGFSVSLNQLGTRPNHDVDILFEDCETSHNVQNGYLFTGLNSPNVTGSIRVQGGRIHDLVGPGIVLFDKSAHSVPIEISDLSIFE